ncbi:sister chromatid cohesion protein SCC4 isoform X1 [Phoenix dactylifera]|uniref:Sister chromatid cohesion protein SCC4 isoform X1 n=1 Tax=Phoenix dactylifera TaxID=42345 RepID=A0A8B7BIM8_PHODC|nr:sister chromatid cohesion protein SCC4 isoform X1 [Phoenix dactylifera]
MGMEAVVEGLWALAEEAELHHDYGGAVKCLEAVLQCGASLLPLVEIRTRLRLASLLLSRSHNLNHAKSHLERTLLLLGPAPPSALPLKFRAHSLLAHCYHLVGAIPPQKHILLRALQLLHQSSLPSGAASLLWSCNFHSQLASALAIEGDYPGALAALASGLAAASELRRPELQMFFAASALHVHLLHWDDPSSVDAAVRRCSEFWDSIPIDQRRHCLGLFFYNELLQTFFLLRICDYKSASQHVEKLDAAMKDNVQKVNVVKRLVGELDAVNRSLSQSNFQRRERLLLCEKQAQLQEQLKALTGLDSDHLSSWEFEDKLLLAPPPLDGEWLPRSAVFALVDLMVVMVGRPKGVFKECGRRIQSGLQLIHEELVKLGINHGVREVDLQHSSIWMSGLYLMLLMQFLENKVAVELTRSEFVEAQEALVQMKNWFVHFPTILQGCESIIEMLRGQYAHSVGCFHEAAFHFIEASKLTESKSMQSMCQVYAAVSYICIGDAESSSQALDLVGPVFRIMDSFVGVREKTCIVFVYGLLLMRQHNLQEARIRLASGLKIAHQQLGNIQLVSQYLTILGTLALQLHDTGQAREILKSSLTLAKTLYDIPTQIWVLSVLTALYREVGERGNEMENSEYERRKEDDLQKRLSEAHSCTHHLDLIEKARIKVLPLHELAIKRAIAGPSTKADLDIPESIDLPTPPPAALSSRLRDIDSVKRGKKKI